MFAVLKYQGRLFIGAVLFVFALAAQTPQQMEQSQRGRDLMAQGHYTEAIPIYQALVKEIPGNNGLLLNLAMAESMGGQAQASIPHLRMVLQADPQNVPALTMLSMSLLQANRPSEAATPLKKLVSAEPNNVNARGMLAGAQMSLGQFGGAAQQYAQITKLTPSDAKAWYGLGKANESLAAAKFDQLGKEAPQSAYVAVLLAETRLQRRQYRSAFFFYREAEKQMPQLPGLHAGLAAVYEGSGHADWAAAETKRESDGQDCRGKQTEACEFLRGNYASLLKATAAPSPQSLFWATRAYNQLARKAFEHLGQLTESTELHAIKAQILHDHGQDLEAVKEWQSALAIAQEPERPRLETELATSYFLGRDYAAAIPALQKLLQQDPQAPELNFMLGESLWRSQQAEKAIPYLKTALAQSPAMLSADAALGLALLSLNRAAEALPHLQKAAKLDEDGSIHYSLSRALLSAGDRDRAQQAMQRYRNIQQKNAEVNGQLAKEAEITAPSS